MRSNCMMGNARSVSKLFRRLNARISGSDFDQHLWRRNTKPMQCPLRFQQAVAPKHIDLCGRRFIPQDVHVIKCIYSLLWSQTSPLKLSGFDVLQSDKNQHFHDDNRKKFSLLPSHEMCLAALEKKSLKLKKKEKRKKESLHLLCHYNVYCVVLFYNYVLHRLINT